MPRPAPRGRPSSLRRALRFQVLRVGFEISADEPAVERALRFLDQSAIQPEPARSIVFYDVRRRDCAYEVSRNGELEDVQFDPAFVLNSLYGRVQGDALEAWPESAVLRAITGRCRGGRFVVVGDTLRERSRLALELIRHGASIEGDDLAILHDGVVTAYPRPLRVCGMDASLPPLAPPRHELPFVGTSPSTGSWALDLALAGVDWTIPTGRVDAVILLETNDGGQTRVSEAPRHEAARVVMSRCDALAGPSHAIRAVAGLVDGAWCYRLRLGSLKDVGRCWPSPLT
jgi:hypothetical protein